MSKRLIFTILAFFALPMFLALIFVYISLMIYLFGDDAGPAASMGVTVILGSVGMAWMVWKSYKS